MQLTINSKTTNTDVVYLIDDLDKLKNISALSTDQLNYLQDQLDHAAKCQTMLIGKNRIFFYYIPTKENENNYHEALRKAGADFQNIANNAKLKSLQIESFSLSEKAAYFFGEGLCLSNYQFLKYKTDAKKINHTLQKVSFYKTSITAKDLNHLSIMIDATYLVRDLVNEPVNNLNAVQLSEAIKTTGKKAGFKVTVWNKAKISSEKMGGILAVNKGSQEPPTFSIMEYKPAKVNNKKPIVLVGKGVVYDTGGLSLKPTPASMDRMKSDMSGAALVTGAMYAIAQLKLPLHIIALVPATDNRPGENAYTPGDVIKMYSGTFVEVLNTDAEGRMILADALHYAKRLNPEFVFDFATLTGAASVAVGDVGIVTMGTANDNIKSAVKDAGFRQYERLVEYPLWDEYGDMIKSDVADIKNIGGPYGGAITAGKFLEHFTDYPWMHFDIAGVSFNTARKKYHTIGGTGFGMRMLVDFLEKYTPEKTSKR